MELEIVFNEEEREFQVWTAGYRVGAIIGQGATEDEAKADAVMHMMKAIKELES